MCLRACKKLTKVLPSNSLIKALETRPAIWEAIVVINRSSFSEKLRRLGMNCKYTDGAAVDQKWDSKEGLVDSLTNIGKQLESRMSVHLEYL